MHVVIDAVVIIISYLAAWLLKFVGPFSGDAVRSLSFEWYMTALFGAIMVTSTFFGTVWNCPCLSDSVLCI